MRRIFLLAVIASLVLVPIVYSVGVPIDIGAGVGDVIPSIWMGDGRIVLDDSLSPGRISPPGTELFERIEDYAFEGEQIVWPILVYDPNGYNEIDDVHVTAGPGVQGPGNPVEAGCNLDSVLSAGADLVALGFDNVIINNQVITLAPGDNVMAVYTCTLTVEDSVGMPPGEYWVAPEVCDLAGNCETIDENEYWYFNPIVVLEVDANGDQIIDFGDDLVPGGTYYSETVLVGNGVDPLSGVMLDMFISGTDFYDLSSSGAMCPTTNQLALSNFAYFATNGAWSSSGDIRAPLDASGEDYVSIVYGDNVQVAQEIICSDFLGIRDVPADCDYNAIWIQSPGNVLSPGGEIAITFRLELPVPCTGNYDSGDINFWAEAI